MNTPVKLNTIDARTINGFDIELNWNTSNKIINAIPVKRAPNRIGVLKDIYEEEVQRAASEDGERTSLRLVPSYSSLRVT